MTKPRNDLIEVFKWNKVPGDKEEEHKLITYLRDHHFVSWLDDSAKIEKLMNGDIIRISNHDKVISITLSKVRGMAESAELIIDGYKIFDFFMTSCNGWLTVYLPGSKSSDLGLWLRRQPGIESKQGFWGINLDYIWSITTNFKIKRFMLLEEKTFVNRNRIFNDDTTILSGAHNETFELFDKIFSTHQDYNMMYAGLHVIMFENTTPDNGEMYIDGELVSSSTFIQFLRSELTDDWYETWFKKHSCINKLELMKYRDNKDYRLGKK